MKSFKLTAYFPNNLIEKLEFEDKPKQIKDLFQQIDWELSFRTAERYLENQKDGRVSEMPYFDLTNNRNQNTLTFTTARNDKMQWKILVFYNWPVEKSSFFGLVKKTVSEGTTILSENKEEAFKLLTLFLQEDHSALKEATKDKW